MWDLLVRLDEQDAEDLVALEAARTKAERSAKSLLTLQADAARAVEEQVRVVGGDRDVAVRTVERQRVDGPRGHL